MPGRWSRTGSRGSSLGAQSFDDVLLRRLGRRHRASDVFDAVAEARAAGVPSVSIDLLYDVPGQSPDGWASTLDAAIDLGVDHVSAYALTLDDPDAEGLTGPTGDHLPTRPGARRWREAAIRDQDDDQRGGAVPARGRAPGTCRLPGLRDLQLGASRAREPPQSRLLAAPAVRGRWPGGTRVRRGDAALERGSPGRLSPGAGPRGPRATGAPAGRGGGHRPIRRGGRGGDPRASAGHRDRARAGDREVRSRPTSMGHRGGPGRGGRGSAVRGSGSRPADACCPASCSCG